MSGFTTYKLVIASLLCLWFGISNASSEGKHTLEVYDTYYSAHKIAGIVDGLLLPNETIKVFSNRLIIKASNDTHQKVLKVLNEIDRAPKNFLISLRTTDQYEAKKQYRNTEIQVLDDNTVIHMGNQAQAGEGVIVYKGSSRDGRITMSVSNRENLSTNKSNLVQQVRAMEGKQAFIAISQETPIQQWIWANGNVLPYQNQQTATKGFYVRPVLSKDQILLEISYTNEDYGERHEVRKKKSTVKTQIRIPLDEWAPLAGFKATDSSSPNATTFSTRQRQNASQGIEIKVETIK